MCGNLGRNQSWRVGCLVATPDRIPLPDAQSSGRTELCSGRIGDADFSAQSTTDAKHGWEADSDCEAHTAHDSDSARGRTISASDSSSARAAVNTRFSQVWLEDGAGAAKGSR